MQIHGTTLPNLEYKDYNGGVFINVLQFLIERRGIDLSQSELQAEAKEIARKRKVDTFLLTYAQRLAYEERLNPDTFDLEELQAFNIGFDDTDEPDFAVAAREAIKVIRNNLRAIPDEQHVLLFDLG